MRNIHSLDGLRAISIALVIIGHLCNGISSERGYTSAILGNGSLGVTVFFVISGYLITNLLLKEFDRDGTISLKTFYARRAFRILPPYYFYLFTVSPLPRSDGSRSAAVNAQARCCFSGTTFLR